MSKQSRRPNRAARHQQKKPPVSSRQGWWPSKNLYWVAALVFAVGLIAAVSVIGKGGNANAAGPLKIGAVAPRVVGKDVQTGQRIDSKQLAGRKVLYYLSEGVMCQACLVQIQALQQHFQHLQRDHLTLVSVTNDDPSTLAQAARDYKIATPLIADQNRTIVKSFGVLGGIPAGVGMHNDTADHTFVLVDKSGHVRFIKDYPKMWIDVNELLKQLPTVS
jgi:thioredoxin-dependent peroxiredoxin